MIWGFAEGTDEAFNEAVNDLGDQDARPWSFSFIQMRNEDTTALRRSGSRRQPDDAADQLESYFFIYETLLALPLLTGMEAFFRSEALVAGEDVIGHYENTRTEVGGFIDGLARSRMPPSLCLRLR